MAGKIRLDTKRVGTSYVLGYIKKTYVDDGFIEPGTYEFTLEELRKHKVGKAGADSKGENARAEI